MDILGLITLVFSILAIVVSILVFIDNRSKTKIMTKQLRLLEEQSEGKQELRNAAKIVTSVRERIAALDKVVYDWGAFGNSASQRFLQYSHDSGGKGVTWEAHPSMLFGKFTMLLDNFDVFLKLFEERLAAESSGLQPASLLDSGLVLNFSSNPKIDERPGVVNDEILVKTYVKAIYSLKVMHDQLASVAKTVGLYDSSLIDDIQRIYLKILHEFHERTQKRYTLEITKQTKAKELPEHLLSFVAFNVWKQCLDELREEIAPRLCEVEKRIMASI